MGKILKGTDYKDKLDLKTKVDFEERSRVLERPSSSGIVSKEVLSAQDQAEGILKDAQAEVAERRAEAKRILEQVQEEMEKSRQQGEERGFEQGLESALEYLTNVHVLKEKMFKDLEPQIVKLVFTVVERVIGKLAQENSTMILGVVSQALDSAMGQKLTIHVNPADYAMVKEKELQLTSKMTGMKTVFFEEDDTVSRGGCLVESEVGAIDAQLITQLNALKKVLGI